MSEQVQESERDWVVTSEWVQATMGEGAYLWRLMQFVGEELFEVEQGVAFSKLGARWQAWRARRRHGFTTRINVRGTV